MSDLFHDLTWYAYQTFLATLFPSFCAYCRAVLAQDAVLCPRCFKAIRHITSSTIMVTPSTSLTVFAVGAYQSPLKELILAKKYGNYHTAGQLARLVVAMTPVNIMSIDVVVPIPLHWSRFMWRGYNQAEVMAEVIAKARGARCISLLARRKRTPFLSSLPVSERAAMVSDALSIKKSQASFITGKNILLVDDLMTTGSTLKTAAKLLLPYKPASLCAVVACRVA
jgi:ComF family protein